MFWDSKVTTDLGPQNTFSGGPKNIFGWTSEAMTKKVVQLCVRDRYSDQTRGLILSNFCIHVSERKILVEFVKWTKSLKPLKDGGLLNISRKI